MQDTIKADGWMDTDRFNFAVRKMYLEEVEKFKGTNYLGWRHFINPDFAVRPKQNIPTIFFFWCCNFCSYILLYAEIRACGWRILGP